MLLPSGRFPVVWELDFLEALALRYVKPDGEKLRDRSYVGAAVMVSLEDVSETPPDGAIGDINWPGRFIPRLGI